MHTGSEAEYTTDDNGWNWTESSETNQHLTLIISNDMAEVISSFFPMDSPSQHKKAAGKERAGKMHWKIVIPWLQI